MTGYGRTILFVATLATAAVAAVLGWVNAWRYWPAPFIAPLAVLVALAANRPRPPAAPIASAEPPAPLPQHFREVLDRDTAVTNVPVPSASVNYEFLLSATVHWRPSPTAPGALNSASPATLARNAIIERAAKQTGNESPVDCVQAQHRLAAALAFVQDDATESLKVWATDVTLSMRPDDLDRLRRLDELDKQREIWEHKRAIEREVAAYFSAEVLKDPGSAVAWWMAKHHERTQEEIEHAVDLIGPLAQLAAAANNEEPPEVFRRFIDPRPVHAAPVAPDLDGHTAPYGRDALVDDGNWHTEAPQPFEPQFEDHLSIFLKELGFTEGGSERARFTRQLADLCEQAARYEAADRIRQTIKVHGFSTRPAEEDTRDDEPGPAPQTPWL